MPSCCGPLKGKTPAMSRAWMNGMAAALLLAPALAAAAPSASAELANAQTIYAKERSACLAGASQQERAACEEVLRQAPVVRLQFVIGVRLGSYRSLAPRQDGGDRSDHHREERRIRIELQRREALGEHGLPKTRFEEVDRQRPGEVDHDQDGEHDPGPCHRALAVAYVLSDIAVPQEGPRRSRLIVGALSHQKTFSITRLRVGVRPEPMSASSRSKV